MIRLLPVITFLLCSEALIAESVYDRIPAICTVNSREMKLVEACGSSNSSASRYIDFTLANDRSANHCYRTVVQVQRKSGYPTQINVMRDEPEARTYQYSVREEQVTQIDGHPVVVLEGVNSRCFFAMNSKSKCTDRPLAIQLDSGEIVQKIEGLGTTPTTLKPMGSSPDKREIALRHAKTQLTSDRVVEKNFRQCESALAIYDTKDVFNSAEREAFARNKLRFPGQTAPSESSGEAKTGK